MRREVFSPSIERLHKTWVANKLYLSQGHDWVDLWTNSFSGVPAPLYFELKSRLRKRPNEFFCTPNTRV